MTRYGMKEDEMEIIALFVKKIADGALPSKIKKEVIEFRKAYQEVLYC